MKLLIVNKKGKQILSTPAPPILEIGSIVKGYILVEFVKIEEHYLIFKGKKEKKKF